MRQAVDVGILGCWMLIVMAGPASPSPAAGPVELTPNTLRLEEGVASPPAVIEDVAWLAGYWRGEGLDGEVEEIWGEPVAGRAMFGTFSLVKGGELVFSEMMTLAEEEGSLVLKVKHFTPEFVGWEEKDEEVTFRLARLGENKAWFGGLTLARKGADELTIYIVLSRMGELTEHELTFRRVSLRP